MIVSLQNLIYKGMDPYTINRIVSMDLNLIEQCNLVNKYMWKVNKDILMAMMRIKFNGKIEYNEYIKKKKDPEDEELIFSKLKEYYGWSNRDLEEQKPLLKMLFKNNVILEEYERMFGIERIED